MITAYSLGAVAPGERLGAAPLETEIRQLVQRARLDLQSAPIPPEPAAQLDITAREAEVLKLLATGRTNREIGRALFISEKTRERAGQPPAPQARRR